MTTILNFKPIVDLPKWRPLAPALTASTTGSSLISDLRNNEDRHPFIFYIQAFNQFHAYDVKKDAWIAYSSPALVSAPSRGVFMPAQGPRGVLAAGNTTTTVVISTVLPATVGPNQLANRGDGRGFRIRIIGNAGAGSSGKTEERLIIANTGPSTTPTITLDSALSFTPAVGDAYEILSGRVFLLGSTNGAGSWKYYDIATNSYSGNLATANLPASFSESDLIGLDEAYVPYDRSPGDGMFGRLTATATGAATLTGQAASGDATVLANEHRNFQIRIVEDIGTPLAVGQRRNITSHTAGPSPVYTVPAWTTQPSATAKYVIEDNGDRILAFITGQANTFTYSISGNAWSTATFTSRIGAPSTGIASAQAFSIEPDAAKNARHSFIYSLRAGNTTTLDVLDISGAAAGLWSNAVVYGNLGTLFTGGTSGIQDPATNQGRYLYLNLNAATRFFRFDMLNRELEPSTLLRYITPSSILSGLKMGYTVFVDGNTKMTTMVLLRSGDVLMFQLPIIM